MEILFAILLFCIAALLWYANENLSRMVNTFNRIADQGEWFQGFAEGFSEKFVEARQRGTEEGN